MARSTPFLYLPDAVSLLLLITGLALFRLSIIEHLQQEFTRMLREVRIYWTSTGLRGDEPALLALEKQWNTFARLASRASPARLFFSNRLLRRMAAKPPDPLSALSQSIGHIQGAKVRDRLRRYQIEMELSIGVCFFFGSLTGWILMSSILLRVALRSFSLPRGKRIDWSMELMEKLAGRIGRQAQQLVLLTGNSTQRHGPRMEGP